MEGRISRGSLERSAEPRNYASPVAERGSYSRPVSRRRTNRSRSYGARGRSAKPELIPDGRDLLIVQLLASGVLLLFVMFVSVVDSEGTNAVREKLNAAFSKNASIEEVSESVSAARSGLSGSADVVLEIFGREISPEADGDIAETSDELRTLEETPPTELTAPMQYIDTLEEAVIDPQLLKEINENLGDYQKN